tara:strand:- start:1532 stop:1996 length:465 start_codon:yes stop_codon:yes gene_type:complete
MISKRYSSHINKESVLNLFKTYFQSYSPILLSLILIVGCDNKKQDIDKVLTPSVIEYHDSGNQKDVAYYDEDKIVLMRRFYDNGKIEIEYEVNKYGHHGYYFEYYENGFVKTKGQWLSSQNQKMMKHGVWNEFDLNGRIKDNETTKWRMGEQIK